SAALSSPRALATLPLTITSQRFAMRGFIRARSPERPNGSRSALVASRCAALVTAAAQARTQELTIIPRSFAMRGRRIAVFPSFFATRGTAARPVSCVGGARQPPAPMRLGREHLLDDREQTERSDGLPHDGVHPGPRLAALRCLTPGRVSHAYHFGTLARDPLEEGRGWDARQLEIHHHDVVTPARQPRNRHLAAGRKLDRVARAQLREGSAKAATTH